MDYSAILISLATASVSIVMTFFLGLAAAWTVFGMRGSLGKSVFDGLLTLPLVLPPTVAGFFLLYLFGVKRPLGRLLLELLGVKIVFSWPATVLAAMAISFPLMYRSALGAFEQINPVYIQAARTIGMTDGRIFRRIVLPLASPGLLSGTILSFARGLGEFGATAMIAGNIAGKTRTLPLAVYSAVAAGNMEEAYSYVAILVGISFLAVTGLNRFQAKGCRLSPKGEKP